MYTGELMDANALVYLRARYYHPGLGVFTGLDPVEGVNRYQYVGGNVTNMVDPSGMITESPRVWDGCWQQGDNNECARCCQALVPESLLQYPVLESEWISDCFYDCITFEGPNPLGCWHGGSYGRNCRVFIPGLVNGITGEGASGDIWEDEFPLVIRNSQGGTKIEHAIEAVEQTRGCINITLVGYSWGADVALIFAQLTPAHIDGLVLLGATLTGTPESTFDIAQTWQQTLTNLVDNGIKVYVLNDIATPELDTVWKQFETMVDLSYFKYDNRPNMHHWSAVGQYIHPDVGEFIDGPSTNLDEDLLASVLAWLSE